MHDVTVWVAPTSPQSVRQAQFDDARAPADVSEAPTARGICQRLGIGWAQLKWIAHAPRATRLQLLRAAQSDRGRKGISLAQAQLAMRQVAVRIGKAWIDRSDYVKGRELMAGRGRRPLPSLNEVDEVLDQAGLTWAQAVEAAGLQRPRRVGQAGLGPREAVRSFAGRLGAVQGQPVQLDRWAKAVAVSLSRDKITVAALKQEIEDLQAERAAQGLDPLPIARPGAELEATGNAVAGRPRRLRGYWNRDRILDGMALAVRHLQSGETLSQRTLKRIARDHRDEPIPSYSTVLRYLNGEDFSDWCREAERRAALGSATTG